MNPLSLLALEMLLSLLLSLIVVNYLRVVLAELLAQACPHGGGLFWIRTLALLQFLAPLLLVVWRSELNPAVDAALEIKQAVAWMLLGHCLALALLARTVWKSLVAPEPAAGRVAV